MSIEFTVDSQKLSSACEMAAATIKRSAIPILSKLLITARPGAIALRCARMEFSFEVAIPAAVKQEGAVLVDAALANKIFSALPEGQVSIEGDKMLLVKGGRSKFRLGVSSDAIESFPTITSGEELAAVPGPLLKEALGLITFAMAQKELAGVGISPSALLHGGFFVSTDGNCMAVLAVPWAGKLEKLVVIADAVRHLARLPSDGIVRIEASNTHIVFRSSTWVLSVVQLAGSWPNWKAVFPKPEDLPISFKANRDELAATLRRAALMSESDKRNPVRLDFKGSNLTIDGMNAEKGTSEEQFTVTEPSGDLTIKLSADYILDFLSVANQPVVEFRASGPDKIVLWRCGNLNFGLMPMQLNAPSSD